MTGLTAQSRPLTKATWSVLRSHVFSVGTVLERDGCSLLAVGSADAIHLPNGLRDPAGLESVMRRLRELAPPRATGSGLPIAVGAMPFRPESETQLLIPELTLFHTASSGMHALIVAREGRHEEVFARFAAEAMAGSRRDGTAPPDSFRLRSARSHEDFLARVAHAVEEVRSGRLDKVVLAREVVIEANRPFRQGDLLERLRSLHPSCMTFSVDGFVGASPELLIRRTGDKLFSDPLAGTAARSGDPASDRRTEKSLLSSVKERQEHRAVVDAIADGLTPVMRSLDVPEGPEIVELRNVSHLRTRIRGTLAERPGIGLFPTALDALALIHPTPAVSGSPVDVALEYLTKTEELDRGRYAGPVGWIRADGDGEFHLGIRAAVVDGASAQLFAGVGIVADSDPLAELQETQLKLQAVLAAAVRP
ncbi:MAG: isochorismate synthase [Acidimicrobiales bacterium]